MKQVDHKEITRFALYNYIDLMSEEFRGLLKENREEIIRATDHEDSWYLNGDRITNWHFYKHPLNHYPDTFRRLLNFKLYSKFVYVEHAGNFQNTLRSLQEKSWSGKRQEKLFRTVGALIHHIQDMGTPSHVVPVFHGRPAPGRFQSCDDQFESYSATHIVEHLSSHLSWLHLGDKIAVLYPDDTFWDIYEDSAQQTMELLRNFRFTAEKKDGGSGQLSCRVFWQEYDFENDPEGGNETAGFGQYGPLEKYFGEQNFMESADGGLYDRGYEVTFEGENWIVRFEDYKELYFQLLRNMVLATLRCLRLVDKQFGELMA